MKRKYQHASIEKIDRKIAVAKSALDSTLRWIADENDLILRTPVRDVERLTRLYESKDALLEQFSILQAELLFQEEKLVEEYAI
jgi:hypothetical protein